MEALQPSNNEKQIYSMRVLLRNEGKRALQFDDADLQMTNSFNELEEDDPNRVHISLNAKAMDIKGLMLPMPPRILRSGQGRSIAFLIPPLAPGNYFVQFRTLY